MTLWRPRGANWLPCLARLPELPVRPGSSSSPSASRAGSPAARPPSLPVSRRPHLGRVYCSSTFRCLAWVHLDYPERSSHFKVLNFHHTWKAPFVLYGDSVTAPRNQDTEPLGVGRGRCAPQVLTKTDADKSLTGASRQLFTSGRPWARDSPFCFA